MKTNSEIVVTLSDDLLESLRAQAQELKVPLKWLVASLVCDTIEPAERPIDPGSRHRRATSRETWPTSVRRLDWSPPRVTRSPVLNP